MPHSIVLLVSENLACALLTILEFILGTIAVLCVRPAISGSWIFWLHRRGSIPIQVGRPFHLASKKELIGLFLAFWFASSVFFVESELESAYKISSSTIIPTYCARMDDAFTTQLLRSGGSSPPQSFLLDEASLTIARDRKRECRNGLSVVDFGSNASQNLLLAPICRDPSPPTNFTPSPLVFGPSDSVRNQQSYTSRHIHYDLPVSFLIPHNVTRNLTTFVTEDRIVSECEQRQLGSVIAVSGNKWATRDLTSDTLGQLVLADLCARHEGSVTGIGGDTGSGNDDGRVMNDLLTACREEADSADDQVSYQFRPECIRQFALNNSLPLYNATLSRYSMLRVDYTNVSDISTADSKATACPGVDVTYEYALVSDRFFQNFSDDFSAHPDGVDRPVLVPTRLSVPNTARCEPVVNSLGLGALYYTARSDWTGAANVGTNAIAADNELLDLEPIDRYHAYVVSIARNYYPYEQLRKTYNCSAPMNVVKEGTKIAFDAGLVFMLAASILSGLLILVASALIWTIPQHSWNLATYTESLSALKFSERDAGAVSLDGLPNSSIAQFINDQTKRQASSGAYGGGGPTNRRDGISNGSFGILGFGGPSVSQDIKNPSIVIIVEDDRNEITEFDETTTGSPRKASRSYSYKIRKLL